MDRVLACNKPYQPLFHQTLSEYTKNNPSRDFKRDQIYQEEIYYLFEELYSHLMLELNRLIQTICHTWFDQAKIKVARSTLSLLLSKPGRTFKRFTAVELVQTNSRLAQRTLAKFKNLGVGIYFFPPLQKKWEAFHNQLINYSGTPVDFLLNHRSIVFEFYRALLHMVHTDKNKEEEYFAKQLRRYLKCLTGIKSVSLESFYNKPLHQDASSAIFIFDILKDIMISILSIYVSETQKFIYRCRSDPEFNQKINQVRPLQKQLQAIKLERESIRRGTELAKAKTAAAEAEAAAEAQIAELKTKIAAAKTKSKVEAGEAAEAVAEAKSKAEAAAEAAAEAKATVVAVAAEAQSKAEEAAEAKLKVEAAAEAAAEAKIGAAQAKIAIAKAEVAAKAEIAAVKAAAEAALAEVSRLQALLKTETGKEADTRISTVPTASHLFQSIPAAATDQSHLSSVENHQESPYA